MELIIFYFFTSRHLKHSFSSNQITCTFCASCFWFPLPSALFSPAGEHLHRGLWGRVPRDHTGSSVRLRLHRFWNHPQWPADLHPLQQVLRLLLQTQVQSVHRLPEETRDGEVCNEDSEKA